MVCRSVIGQQQQFLVSCEARAWSLNRLLPPDGPVPSFPPVTSAGGSPGYGDAAAAAATARQVTEGMARCSKERAAGRAGLARESPGVTGPAKAGLVGRLRRLSLSHGGQGGGLADMALKK